MNTLLFSKRRLVTVLVAIGVFLCAAETRAATTVTVLGHNRDGNEVPVSPPVPVDGYRWVLQEDATYNVVPGVPVDPAQAPQLSGRFHVSHLPVIAEGTSADLAALDAARDPAKRYYLSVLPYTGFAMGGAAIPAGADANVTIDVNVFPIPTAQISVFAFEEKQINGAPDLPEETGLAGFDVLLFEAGGQYGMAGGQVLEDGFGNPIGTTYNADGSVLALGDGTIRTDADGNALIRNLAPGKYGIQVVPPAGQGWIQTSTIEGTKTIDAWVKANEPAVMTEFGPAGPHAFIGFVKTDPATGKYENTARLTGGATIAGHVVNQHMSRPPQGALYSGDAFSHSTCWVGLNDLGLATLEYVYAARCNPDDNSFSISNVPPGQYQVVVWDDYLDLIISSYTFVVNGDLTCSTPTGSCNLQEVPVFNWFGRHEHIVFEDINGNGFRDEGEPGIPEQAINLRFRDGRMNQSAPTDLTGFVPFDEVFPFFSWMVAEVDFARFKATGVTYVVDAGGPVPADNGWTMPSRGMLNPQLQPENGNLPYRTISAADAGAPPLLLGFQQFLGQTSIMEWGKKAYTGSENGGISGIVYYAATRAEDDPRFAAAEPWEPGIPRVQVSLYKDFINNATLVAVPDGQPDDLNGIPGFQAPDIDNYPLGNFPGPEDIDHTDAALGYTDGTVTGTPDLGDAFRVTHTDSWDDNQPTGCVGDPAKGEVIAMDGVTLDCYDNLRVFNQVRPAVFDGGYAFGNVASNSDPLVPGTYIVETVVPPGYTLAKEEDRNVDFGEPLKPAPALLPAACVGAPHTVQDYMSFQTDAAGVPLPGIDPAELVAVPAAGTTKPLCDRKQVRLAARTNAAADFFLFTQTPPASLAFGIMLNDLGNEFSVLSPQFGEKYAPPNLPVAFRDWTGREIGRVYADQYGRFNTPVPSSYSANAPMPSGFAPNIVQACMNDAGPIRNPAHATDPAQPEFITDPYYNPQYSQFCYTLMYMPGATTYLDTPVVPIAAFVGDGQFPVDCECENGTPVIQYVTNPAATSGGPIANVGDAVTIASQGTVMVPNPAYDGPGGVNPKLIPRDYGFGTMGGTVTIGGIAAVTGTWTNDTIVATVPAGAATGELLITRNDTGKTSKVGVTLTVGAANVIDVADYGSIQAAIDAANNGDIVMIPPGIYNEQVIMWKPVKLQGWGAGSVLISALNMPTEKRAAWQAKIDSLIAASGTNGVTLLPGQLTLATEESAGILVLRRDDNYQTNPTSPQVVKPRIDGVTIVGADLGGGIAINGLVPNLTISNNRISNNAGVYGGGIRSGNPILTQTIGGDVVNVDAGNDRLNIHHNQIAQNGHTGESGAGGGIALYAGNDHYKVTDNFICGNFSNGPGGGISHLGLSDGGKATSTDDANNPPNLIARNTIVFNQSFLQAITVDGGGISIQGAAPLEGAVTGPGAGTVTIDANLIQGNQAGAGDGGGIYVARFNGQDAEMSNPGNWHLLTIGNNIIANNMAGVAGGGISLHDVAYANMHQNTIANNDSTATAGAALDPMNPNQSSISLPAGVVSYAHSAELAAALDVAKRGGLGDLPSVATDYSKPDMSSNIIWHNRSFHYEVVATDPPTPPALVLDGYDDLAVVAFAGGCLAPKYSILTDPVGEGLADGCDYSTASNNLSADPVFNTEYFNGARGTLIMGEVATGIPQLAGAFDEGGNFIDVQFGPLSLWGYSNYHIADTSPAIGKADTSQVLGVFTHDFDGGIRPEPAGSLPDIGADENHLAPAVANVAPAGVKKLRTLRTLQTSAAAPGTATTLQLLKKSARR